MEFRKAMETDIDGILKIIAQAQAYLKAEGIDQWQNNYPNYETIKNDIDNKNSYVLLKDNIIVGTTAVIFDGEETYTNIYHGEWLSDKEYTTIHRIAVDSSYKRIGLASIILKNVEKLSLDKNINSIKVDTHKENISMQEFLKRNGFKHCGLIYLEDGNERVAFEKIL